MIEVVDTLTGLGYIHHKVGFYSPRKQSGVQPVMAAEPKLVCLFDHFALQGSKTRTERDEIVLQLGKKREKKPVHFEDTAQTIEWRKNVTAINGFLSCMDIRLGISESKKLEYVTKYERLPDFTLTSLYRVFNSRDFDLGGRFYGVWWQGDLKKEFRKYILINGEPTVELDYSSLHLFILYTLTGQDPPKGDLYSVEGIDPKLREMLKKAMLAMLNAQDKGKAIGGTYDDEVNKQFNLSKREIGELMDLLAAKHWRIKSYFYQGYGSAVQFIDSCMAESIMLRLLAKEIPCLPVHDSFITPVEHERELREAMERAPKEQLGVIIPVERKD